MHEQIKFKATEVYADYDENDLLIIGFSSADNYFMIQDAFDREDEQEIELGMDTFYIELNDQSQGSYGGISRLHLYQNLISLTLNDIGKSHLNTEANHINIELDINAEKLIDLKDKLTLIFAVEKDTTIIFSDLPAPQEIH